MDLYAQVILSNSQKISIHCCSYLLLELSTTNRLYLSLRSMTNQVLLQTLKKMTSFKLRQRNRAPKDLQKKDRTPKSLRLMSCRELKKRRKNIPLIGKSRRQNAIETSRMSRTWPRPGLRWSRGNKRSRMLSTLLKKRRRRKLQKKKRSMKSQRQLKLLKNSLQSKVTPWIQKTSISVHLIENRMLKIKRLEILVSQKQSFKHYQKLNQ